MTTLEKIMLTIVSMLTIVAIIAGISPLMTALLTNILGV